MNSKYFRKSSIISVVLVAVVISCFMAGCQKEMEDEMMCRIEIKKIDVSYNPVRLKSGSECECCNKTLVASCTVSYSNPQQIVTLPAGGGKYELQFSSFHQNSTSKINMKNATGTTDMSHTNLGGANPLNPEVYELTPAPAGGVLSLNYQSGSPGQVYIYRCNN